MQVLLLGLDGKTEFSYIADTTPPNFVEVYVCEGSGWPPRTEEELNNPSWPKLRRFYRLTIPTYKEVEE